jgi:hypothetical protein
MPFRGAHHSLVPPPPDDRLRRVRTRRLKREKGGRRDRHILGGGDRVRGMPCVATKGARSEETAGRSLHPENSGWRDRRLSSVTRRGIRAENNPHGDRGGEREQNRHHDMAQQTPVGLRVRGLMLKATATVAMMAHSCFLAGGFGPQRVVASLNKKMGAQLPFSLPETRRRVRSGGNVLNFSSPSPNRIRHNMFRRRGSP